MKNRILFIICLLFIFSCKKDEFVHPDYIIFGLGIKLATDKKREIARQLLSEMREEVGVGLADNILAVHETDESAIKNQKKDIIELKKKLRDINHTNAKILLQLADFLAEKSIWIIGGDGWAGRQKLRACTSRYSRQHIRLANGIQNNRYLSCLVTIPDKGQSAYR